MAAEELPNPNQEPGAQVLSSAPSVRDPEHSLAPARPPCMGQDAAAPPSLLAPAWGTRGPLPQDNTELGGKSGLQVQTLMII